MRIQRKHQNFVFSVEALCDTPPTTVGSICVTVVSTIVITTNSCCFRNKMCGDAIQWTLEEGKGYEMHEVTGGKAQGNQ
jgi:hypothetical protein